MEKLRIEIKGEGTKQEIIAALTTLIDGLVNTVSVEEQAEAGIEWEDSVLMTYINIAEKD